ncbi:hypothetical protein Ddye_026025 [Dipteronia dyeriana]|uniref:Uncharacterized protein n=1 Tax=Dipteronia dyeriana TaxID=168575 RepID=A0AAD9TMH9_9ROSI|nr:hypothetical protein Ddye_026025 [Dipteronia dyeriana]
MGLVKQLIDPQIGSGTREKERSDQESLTIEFTLSRCCLGIVEVSFSRSFSYPTDTLLPGQVFFENISLKSFPSTKSLSVYIEIKSEDVGLYAGYRTPQTYWSLTSDSRKTNKSLAGKVHSVPLVSNAWKFYDQDKALLWHFIFSENSD